MIKKKSKKKQKWFEIYMLDEKKLKKWNTNTNTSKFPVTIVD